MKKLIIILASLYSGFVCAQELLTIETTITGSKEQPKVISIVPWQNTQTPGYFGEDIGGLGKTDVIPLIDRRSFNLELRYISSMRKNTQK